MNAYLIAIAAAVRRAIAPRFPDPVGRHPVVLDRDADRERFVRGGRDVHDVERRDRSWDRLESGDGWVGGWR